MKKISIIFSLVLFASTLFAQSEPTGTAKEYLVCRVRYMKKMKVGLIHRLFVDIGTNKTHSLSGKVLNNESEGSVVITDFSGKSTTLDNEIDMLMYFSSIGWKLMGSTPISILDGKWNQYLFYKEIVKF